MYLSKLSLNTLDRKTWNLLRDPYHVHAAIMRAFPETKGKGKRREAGILFRREPNDRSACTVYVLVQSLIAPDWAPLLKEYSSSLQVDARTVEPDFETNQKLSFRLRANPIVKRDNKRLGLVGEQSQRDWLQRKALSGGFALAPESFTVTDEGYAKGEKWENNKKFELSFYTVLYQGTLQISDVDKFLKESIWYGVGPSKGFGCGLLSVSYKRS